MSLCAWFLKAVDLNCLTMQCTKKCCLQCKTLEKNMDGTAVRKLTEDGQIVQLVLNGVFLCVHQGHHETHYKQYLNRVGMCGGKKIKKVSANRTPTKVVWVCDFRKIVDCQRLNVSSNGLNLFWSFPSSDHFRHISQHKHYTE